MDYCFALQSSAHADKLMQEDEKEVHLPELVIEHFPHVRSFPAKEAIHQNR
jgi:hypothetical protein